LTKYILHVAITDKFCLNSQDRLHLLCARIAHASAGATTLCNCSYTSLVTRPSILGHKTKHPWSQDQGIKNCFITNTLLLSFQCSLFIFTFFNHYDHLLFDLSLFLWIYLKTATAKYLKRDIRIKKPRFKNLSIR